MKDTINKATQGPNHPSKSPTDRWAKIHNNDHALHETPIEVLIHLLHRTRRYLHLVGVVICEP